MTAARGGDYRFFGKGHVEFKDALNGSLFINNEPYHLAKTMKHLIKAAHGGNAGYVALAGDINAKGEAYTPSPISCV
ncbi:MAG: hypothetical protein WDM89_20520 [Rhizomicrobium sp.]